MSGGQAFEAETAGRLRALGWSTSTTAVTGDWGADVIGRIGGECLVVQCKDWDSPVGLSAVQEVAFARTHYQAQLAAVVSRNGYTRAAKAAARTAGVHLLALEDICVGASTLDRSEESARLREKEHRRREEERLRRVREAEAESEREAAQAWGQFDRAIARRRLLLPWFKRLGIAMIVVGVIGLGSSVSAGAMALLEHHEVAVGVSGAGAILALGILLTSTLLYPSPRAPDIPRRAALRDCPCCELRLRLEVGRSGWLTCPRCKWRFHAETYTPLTPESKNPWAR